MGCAKLEDCGAARPLAQSFTLYFGEGERASRRAESNARYNASVRILISAGEASGEMYGAELIEALRRRGRAGAADRYFPAQQGGAGVPARLPPRVLRRVGV